jgi:hypothetical protein
MGIHTQPDGSVEVHLQRAMYMQQAIKDAMATFEDFATFELSRGEDHYIVKVSDPDPDIDGDLIGEFANFALYHTIERKRRRHK